jgi:hypothetical protein
LNVPPLMERELCQLAALRQTGRRGKTQAAVASHAPRFETNRASLVVISFETLLHES